MLLTTNTNTTTTTTTTTSTITTYTASITPLLTSRINHYGIALAAGKISFRNLKRVAKELGENMTDEELQEMIDEADRDGDGEISEDEFLRIMKKTSLY